MRLRRHLTYANVTATFALVLAAGTGAVYAAGEIGSREIANNSVRTQDLKDARGVKGKDARRNTFGGREVAEGDLIGSRIVTMEGTQAADCDPAQSVFGDCAAVTLDLANPSRMMVTATGGFSGESASGSRAECEVRVDGGNQPLSEGPGEVSDNSDATATNGFARTLVTPPVASGLHTYSLACQQIGPNDARIRAPTISVIAVTTR